MGYVYAAYQGFCKLAYFLLGYTQRFYTGSRVVSSLSGALLLRAFWV